MRWLLGLRVRASFSLTLNSVALKKMLLMQLFLDSKRQALLMTPNLYAHGRNRDMDIRRFQSASLRGSYAKKACSKNLSMQPLMRSMKDLNIAQLLIWDLKNTTPCRALNLMFRLEEFRVCCREKVLVLARSRKFCASSIF